MASTLSPTASNPAETAAWIRFFEGGLAERQ